MQAVNGNYPAAAEWLDEFNLAMPPPGFVDNPYPFYAALRARSPVHRIGERSWLLTRHDDVVAVYRHPAASSDKRREFAPKFGLGSPLYEHHTNSLVFNDAPRHTRIRRLLMGALSQRTIYRMESDVQRLVQRLLDELTVRPGPCLIEHFAARIPVDVIGNMLDVPVQERGPLRAWSLAILSALEPQPAAETLAAGNRAVVDFCTFLRKLITHRRQQPGDPEVDVLTRLIQFEPEGERLNEAELLHNCIFLLNAGHETTTNLIGNGVHALQQAWPQWQRLVAQPQLLTGAVEELLRYESPVQLSNRLAHEDIALPSGTVLPAGSFITLAIGAANRDPAVFESPEELDIGRKAQAHVAFGHGAHACAGMNVARLEARVALGALAARFPGLRLLGAGHRDRRIRFRGFTHLPVDLA
jgi:cytochrome P450